MTHTSNQTGAFGPKVSKWCSGVAVWSLIVMLAWAPFPLGSAVSWGAGLLELMTAGCWIIWLVANWQAPESLWPTRWSVRIPLMLALGVLVWAVIQTLTIVPTSWAHPIWSMAADAFGQAVPATISIDPWRTESQTLLLACSVAICLLVYSMAQRAETASTLFNAVIVIGATFAAYAFVLDFLGISQAQLIYSVPFVSADVSGPFMMRNSFATYAGLITLAAAARLFESARQTVTARRGLRQLGLTLIQFALGRSAALLIAALVLFAALVASASRGGFVATGCGLLAMAIVSSSVARRTRSRAWAGIEMFAVTAPLFILALAGPDRLSDRIDQLLDAGNADTIRLALWAAARHMIADAPFTGMGLGTFQDAYPLYATQVYAFVMDKAHCDYLEFAAGIGLPAAIAWWTALAWLAFLCLRGALLRRRNQPFALTAFGASVLVGVHSSVDFSLQLPAVALTYATLLGLGAAQSFNTKAHSRPIG